MTAAATVLAAGARLRAHGLMAKKSWGQHFLRDRAVLADIVAQAALQPGQAVLELGAGLGALTLDLLGAGARVTAVERDRDLAPLLRAELAPLAVGAAALHVMEADAARLDYAGLAAAAGGPLTVLGNLPYQLSSRILVSLADAGDHVRQATVLVQREVAQRLAAPSGSRAYGLLSVLVQRRFEVHALRVVAPGAFVPPPKVTSQVVHLVQRRDVCWRQGGARGASTGQQVGELGDEACLVAAARAAFSARRKQLGNSLAVGLKRRSGDVVEAIVAAGLAADCRAETLAVAQFLQLGRALRERGLLQPKAAAAP